MNENNFNVKYDPKIKNNYIRGDNILIRNILEKEFYIKNFKFFKKYNLIFLLNQLTTLDGSQILGESFFKRRKYCFNNLINSKDLKIVIIIKKLENN
jgi:hypothetical protein